MFSTASLAAAGAGGIDEGGGAAAFAGALAGAGAPPAFGAAAAAAPTAPTEPSSAPTATVSPVFTAMSASTPEAGALTSKVTLSVSSSTSGSSTLIASPGCLNHLPTVASVIDSPSAGTRISVAISSRQPLTRLLLRGVGRLGSPRAELS